MLSPSAHLDQIILASASPARRALLEELGIRFTVIPSGVNEMDHPEKDPVRRAAALAKRKATDIANWHKESLVIGCDTLVVAKDGMLLEKPKDAADARAMLMRQSNGVSMVHSAVCLVTPNGTFEGLDSSAVHFAELQNDVIDWWVESRLWEGKSGAFQISGPGQLLIRRIEGDWSSIVGLPVFLLGELFTQAGKSLRAHFPH